MNSRGRAFLEQLNETIVVGDGGFGTRLYDLGIGLDISYEQLNLTRPDLVERVFREYVDAGAQLIETNSFCANHHKQKRFGLERDVVKMARASAEISRRVAGPDRFVAGSIGPLARRRRELDEYSRDELLAMFHEPMRALLEGGADLLLLETFTMLAEIEVALEAARKFDVPIICEMAFSEESTTEAGITPERAARRLTELGAHVIGANCRSGPLVLREVIERQGHATALPLSVFPNAGYAQQIDGRYIYQASPQYFGEQTAALVAVGAHLIGGCCGTTPDHIRAIAAAAKSLKPAKGRIVVEGPVTEPPRAIRPKGGEIFRKLLARPEPFVTVEIEPPRGLEFKKSLDGARLAAKAGCDAINVPDNALAKVRMDNVIFADLLRQHIDLPVILHLTCRDKNMIALQADLLGAQMVGIEAVLAVTGDPASIGDQPGASSVYDINSIGLVELIQNLNQGMTAGGTPLNEPTNFAIGVGLNANVRGEKGMEAAFFKLRKKIAAGAQFVESQPIYDPAILTALLTAAADVDIPICVGIMPIVSERNAEFLHNEVPGIRIPDDVRLRFKGITKKDEAEAIGLAIAKEIIDLARPKARHFYIIPPLRRYDLAAELVRYIKS